MATLCDSHLTSLGPTCSVFSRGFHGPYFSDAEASESDALHMPFRCVHYQMMPLAVPRDSGFRVWMEQMEGSGNERE